MPADDQILELLDNSDLQLPPGVIARNLGYSRSHISGRLSELKDRGFVRVVNEKSRDFRITERGRGYLAGEVDASEDGNES